MRYTQIYKKKLIFAKLGHRKLSIAKRYAIGYGNLEDEVDRLTDLKVTANINFSSIIYHEGTDIPKGIAHYINIVHNELLINLINEIALIDDEGDYMMVTRVIPPDESEVTDGSYTYQIIEEIK